jgi:hypothetical protein
MVADGKSPTGATGAVFEKVIVGAGPGGAVSSTGNASGGVAAAWNRLTGSCKVAEGLSPIGAEAEKVIVGAGPAAAFDPPAASAIVADGRSAADSRTAGGADPKEGAGDVG